MTAFPARGTKLTTTGAALALLLVAALPGCARVPTSEPVATSAHEGNRGDYQRRLLHAIRSADRVVVTEHSNAFDRFRGDMPDGPYVVYATHTLDDRERSTLLHQIESIDPQVMEAVSMCLFSPHHALEFYVGEQRRSTLEICFTCGQLQWSAVDAYYPPDVLRVFMALVSASGMTPDQDWEAKASVLERDSPRDEYRDPANKRWRFGAEW